MGLIWSCISLPYDVILLLTTGKMMEEEDEDTLFDQAEIGNDRTALLHPDKVSDVFETHKVIRAGPSRCYKVFSTICLCAAFLGLGLCIAIPGPTLLDLQQQTSTDTETISRLFTGRSVGYLLGSVISGILFDKVNQPCLLSVSLLLTAVATALAPWCSKFIELVFVFAFQGLSMGFLDTGGNVMCVQTWGEGNGPWMQALHFSFGIGAFVAPLIAEPFLSKNKTSYLWNNDTNHSWPLLPPDINSMVPAQGIQPPVKHDRSVREAAYYDDDQRFVNEHLRDSQSNGVQKRALTSEEKSEFHAERDVGTGPKKRALHFFHTGSGMGLVDLLTQKLIEALQKLKKVKDTQPTESESKVKGTGNKVTGNEVKENSKSFDGKGKLPIGNPTTRKPLSRKQRPRPQKPQLQALPLGFEKNPVNNKGRNRQNKAKNTESSSDNDVSSSQGREKVEVLPSKNATVFPSTARNNRAETVESTGNMNGVITTGLFQHTGQVSYTPTGGNANASYTPTGGNAKISYTPTGDNTNATYIPTKQKIDLQTNSFSSKATELSFTPKLSTQPKPKRVRPRPNRKNFFGFPLQDNNNDKARKVNEVSGKKTVDLNSRNITTEESEIKKASDEKTSEVGQRPRPNRRKRPEKFLPGGFYSQKSSGGNGGGKRNGRSRRSVNSTEEKTPENKTLTADVSGSHNGTTTPTTTTRTAHPNRPFIAGGNLNPDTQVANGHILKKPLRKQNKQSPDKSPAKEVKTNDDKAEKFPSNRGNTSSGESRSEAVYTAKSTATTSTTVTSTSTTTTTTSTSTTTTTTTSPSTVSTERYTVKSLDIHPALNSTDIESFGNASSGESGDQLSKYAEKVKVAMGNLVATVENLSLVQFAYLTIAAYLFLVSALLAVLCCHGKCTLRSLKLTPTLPDSKTAPRRRETKGFKAQLLILLFLFFFLYVGMEITYGGLLLTFVVEHLGWDKSSGSLITSVFFGSFAAARGISIFVAKCLSPTVILVVDLVLTTVALIGLLITIETNPAMIWYLNVVLGVGMASIFPTGVSWAEQYLDLTGKATASFVVGSALGEMLLPAFTGFMFEQKGPMWLLYILMGCALFSAVIYIIMQNLASNSGGKYSQVTRLRDVTLTDLDHSTLEMDRIPLTPDLQPDEEPLIGSHSEPRSNGFYQHNGTVVKARKKVTFNFNEGNGTQCGDGEGEVKPKVKASILKGTIKTT